MYFSALETTNTSFRTASVSDRQRLQNRERKRPARTGFFTASELSLNWRESVTLPDFFTAL
jgi:hypothetical protein